MSNSLAAHAPGLAAEWHRTRNGPLSPSDVTRGSRRSVWWCCVANPRHVWHATVLSRTTGGTGCPKCARSGAMGR